MNIAIIGAGIGGLTSAALLASDGHSVTVYEKNDFAGGKMNEMRVDGFRFDMGPSLLTMPEILTLVYADCGEELDDYLTVEPLEPLCRYFFNDGTRFDNFNNLERSLAEVERIAPSDRQSYAEFLQYARKLYQNAAPSFLFNPLSDVSDLRDLNFADLSGIDALTTVSNRVDDYFSTDYMRKFFKRFTTYNGSSPFRAPATLNVIPHVEINKGGYYVKGGIYRIAEALHELAKKKGARFTMNAEVDTITTTSGRVSGITLKNGTHKNYDLVVSNSDAFETYHHLLPEKDVDSFRKALLSRAEPSCSGFVLLLGINRSYEQLRHHNVFFSDDYRQEFDAIFSQNLPPDDPTIYVANTSYTDPEDAIEGGSNLFILVNAPYLTEKYDWEEKGASYASHVLDKLEKRGLKKLRSSIIHRQKITPLDFYQKYRSYRGSIYGTSSNSRLSAFMRPGNKARTVDGLYLTGGSTHPGGGIPLVILSALHASTLIKRNT